VPLEFRGIGKFLRAFSEGRIAGILKDQQKLAMRRAVLHLRSQVLSYIDEERHGIPNAPLTILIKGSSRPLVDRGDLRLSITTDVAGEGRNVVGAVGVLRRRRAKRGRKMMNIAIALHDGFVVRVTPQVRAAVFAELLKRQGKRSTEPRGGGTTTWRVRGRPFISQPLEESHGRIVEILGDGVMTWMKKL
jgi:hypothetical protein